jgi:hypothetical protein
MNSTPLLKTRKQIHLMFVRSCLSAGVVVLLTQIGVRILLAGLTRQNIEEILWPFAILTCLLMLFCSIGAFLHREHLLGAIAALVSALSMLIGLLPILLEEGVRD